MDLNIKQKIVTDNKNTFFTANKFMTGSSIPTEGEYVKGDIIVNIGENAAEEPMWICVEAGNPGVWQLVGIASDDDEVIGESFEKLVSLKSRTVVTEEVSEVAIGISGFNKASDTLVVFINSVFATEGVDYTINDNSTKILPVGENWNKEFLDDFEFDFIVLKHVEQMSGTVAPGIWEVIHLKSHTVITEEVSEVEIGIPEFNKEADDLTVYRNSTHMIEGVDYKVEGGKIVSLKGNWNMNNSETIFAFEVVKTVAKVNPDAVVGMDNLTEDVKQAIENASNVDLSGYVEQTEYNSKIAELENRVNEAFTNANNGKELIASAIGEPVSAEDTFSAMSTDINGLLSTFKTNMMNNGVTVESGDKFKSLIDKIATMVEEGEGKGIHFNLIEKQNDLVYEAPIGNHFNNQTIQLTVNHNLGYTPNYIFFNISELKLIRYNSSENIGANNIIVSNISTTTVSSYHYDEYGATDKTITLSITNINETSFDVSLTGSVPYVGQKYIGAKSPNYIAIGVGEEDTTLRDSLASILTEEGVSVTEEDDMASLINKVDSEFSDKENEISNLETELAGKVTPVGTAVVSNVLSGKTFINSTGNTLTGTMANNGTKTITPKASAQTLGAGYYDKITINGDADLVAANIVSGKNIFGVTGTASTLKSSSNFNYAFFTSYDTTIYINNGASDTKKGQNYLITSFTNNAGDCNIRISGLTKHVSQYYDLAYTVEYVRNGSVVYTSTIETVGNKKFSTDYDVLKKGDVLNFYIKSISNSAKNSGVKDLMILGSLSV